MSDDNHPPLSASYTILAVFAGLFGLLFGMAVTSGALHIHLIWPLLIIGLLYALVELFFYGLMIGLWRGFRRLIGRPAKPVEKEETPADRLISKIFGIGFLGGSAIALLSFVLKLVANGAGG